MKRIHVIIFLLTSIIGACSKEDDPTLPEATPLFLLTASDYKKWEMIDPAVPIEVNKPLPVIAPPCMSGEVKNGLGYFYHLYTNGTVEFQDGCGATASDRALVKGTWSFSDDKKTVTVSLDGYQPQTWTINDLTVARLIVDVNGTKLAFAPTPVRR